MHSADAIRRGGKKQGVPGHWDPLHETYTAWPTTPLSVTQN